MEASLDVGAGSVPGEEIGPHSDAARGDEMRTESSAQDAGAAETWIGNVEPQCLKKARAFITKLEMLTDLCVARPNRVIDVDDKNNSNDEGDADCIVEAVILDPARPGCSKDILSEIRKLRPKRIVYVSCNPDTQARDASILFGNEDKTGGPSSLPTYSLASVKPCDMFPHALHVETVAVFDRVD